MKKKKKDYTTYTSLALNFLNQRTSEILSFIISQTKLIL